MADDSIADMTKVCTRCGVAKPANSSYFYRAKSGPLGFTCACKSCLKLQRDGKPKPSLEKKALRSAARRADYAAGIGSAKRYASEYRAANPDKIKAARLAWYIANQDYAKKQSRISYHSDATRQQALMKAWREANPDYHKKYSLDRYYQDIEAGRAKCRAHRAADPAKHRERFRVWVANNPDKMRDGARLRRARKVGTTTEKIVERDVFDRDGWKCYICGIPVTNDRPFGAPDKAVQEHVIPLSRGDTHTKDNVRCACHRCNQIKGASLTPEQVRARLQTG